MPASSKLSVIASSFQPLEPVFLDSALACSALACSGAVCMLIAAYLQWRRG